MTIPYKPMPEALRGYFDNEALGYIRAVFKGDLVLFNYTDKCVYDKAWNEYTRNARGIIFNWKTGQLVAKPFPKFFNLGEMSETQLENLPQEPYKVFDKLDGSLGILYYYEGKWNVATRGSFDSVQAKKAESLLMNYQVHMLSKYNTTYLVEIIYPDNKIVVNYGAEEKLIMLAAYNGETELAYNALIEDAYNANMPVATYYEGKSIEQAIADKEWLPKDHEGYVIRFASGLRIKVKGNEYLRIHKIVTNLSPLAFWEVMEEGYVPQSYIQEIPEEFRSEFNPIVETLQYNYQSVKRQIEYEVALVNNAVPPSYSPLKDIGLFIQRSDHGLRHPAAIFPYILGRQEALDKYIMKTIRPKGNVL